MLRRLISIFATLPILIILGTTVSFACSGPSPFDFADLPLMDVWVRAAVIDVDDRGYSAILRVHEYYKGEGPALLAVVRFPVG